MKFNFKIQQYQTDAVDAVVNVFNGQSFHDRNSYIRDLGKMNPSDYQMAWDLTQEEIELYDPANDAGYKNEEVELSDEQLLSNIHTLQSQNNIKLSPALIKNLGRCSLDIEMETGTGKTYVYIKTMFELNKKYGWSKFIVVVPSIAIREGVKKFFEITSDHFMEHYGKKARFFIYNSSNLNQLDNFSSSNGISVMIINTQAFASSLKKDGRSKEARIIYSKRDEFGSRRPIDVIKANRPIIILDEPQKMGGDVTQKALKNFNPLFSLNYSATHAKQHNLIYVLDALDAFNKKLVKRIEVKGFEIKNLRGTDSYLYLEQIVLSSKKPPMAKIELEIKYNKSINRETRILGVGDDLYFVSRKMEQYKGYIVSEIDPLYGTVTFTNGEIIKTGDIVGDISEKDMRRIQIRETIISHFEKEEKLFNMGIKCLSLFFIDEVAKYRQYDQDGNEILGEYGQMFEQEYINILNEYIRLSDTPYQKYLKSSCSDVSAVHKGYFSIDKKTGRNIDSRLKRGSEFSDDISAYDLILKNKERLLSFEEPTRFIFSHSALREGWDNPNVFQICTLKHSDSNTAKRQEVGRGLRLCVNRNGNRMDVQSCGETVHDVNILTVVASESYKTFVVDLQSDIKTVLYDRPNVASSEYFKGKYIKVDDIPTLIDENTANAIEFYLIQNGYVDMKRKVTEKYRSDVAMKTVKDLPEELKPMTEGIHTLIQSVYDDSIMESMFTNGHEPKVKKNPLNENFFKREFQALWKEINHKYAYTVKFDSEELIRKAIAYIDQKLFVSELQYTTTVGRQKSEMNEYEIEGFTSFTREKTRTQTFKHAQTSKIKYDLIGKVVVTDDDHGSPLHHAVGDRVVVTAHNTADTVISGNGGIALQCDVIHRTHVVAHNAANGHGSAFRYCDRGIFQSQVFHLTAAHAEQTGTAVIGIRSIAQVGNSVAVSVKGAEEQGGVCLHVVHIADGSPLDTGQVQITGQFEANTGVAALRAIVDIGSKGQQGIHAVDLVGVFLRAGTAVIVGGNSSGADGRSSRRTCGSAACGTLGGRTCTA